MTPAFWLALASVATWVPAYTPYTTSAGATVHWDTDLFCYDMSAALPDGWNPDRVESLLTAAVTTWGSLACAPKDLRYDGRVDEAAIDPATGSGNTVVWVREPGAWTHNPAYYALTTLTARRVDGVILDADLEVNAGGHRFSLTDDCPPDSVDLANTLTHEAGHLMGLDHSQVPGAALFGAAEPGDTFMRVLAADDIEGYCWLAATYPPTGQVSPCGGAPGESGVEPASDTVAPAEIVAEPDDVGSGAGSGGCGPGARTGGALVTIVLAAGLALAVSRAGSRTRS